MSTVSDSVEGLKVSEQFVFSDMLPGVFTDPDHDGLAFVDSARVNFTFGGGLVIAQRLQIDGAVNIAEGLLEGLLSTVVRF